MNRKAPPGSDAAGGEDSARPPEVAPSFYRELDKYLGHRCPHNSLRSPAAGR